MSNNDSDFVDLPDDEYEDLPDQSVPELPTAELPEMPKNTLEQRGEDYIAEGQQLAADKEMGRGEAAAYAAGGGLTAGWLPSMVAGHGAAGVNQAALVRQILSGRGKAPAELPVGETEQRKIREGVASKIGEAHQTYPYQSALVSGVGAAPTVALTGPLAYGLASGASQPAEGVPEFLLNTAVGGGVGALGSYFPKATAGTLGGAGLAATIDERASIPGFTDTQAGRNIAMGSAIPAVGGGIASLIGKRAGKTGAAQQSMLEEGIAQKAAPLEKKQIKDYRVSEKALRSKQEAAKDIYVEAEKQARAAYKSKKASEGGFTRKALDRYVSSIDEALKDPNITPEDKVFWENFREEVRADAKKIAATKQSPQELAKSQAAEKWDPLIEIKEARKNKAAADAKLAQQSPETLINELSPEQEAALIRAAEEQRLSEDFKRTKSVLPVGEEPMPYAEVRKGGVRKKLESDVAKRAADLEATKDSMIKERLRQAELGKVIAGPEAAQPLDSQLTQLARLYSAAKASQSRAKAAGQIEAPATAISRLLPAVLQQSSSGQTNTPDEDVKRKIFELIAAQTGGK